MLAEVLSGLLRNIDGENVGCFNFDGDFSTEDGDRNPTLRVGDSSLECLGLSDGNGSCHSVEERSGIGSTLNTSM